MSSTELLCKHPQADPVPCCRKQVLIIQHRMRGIIAALLLLSLCVSSAQARGPEPRPEADLVELRHGQPDLSSQCGISSGVELPHPAMEGNGSYPDTDMEDWFPFTLPWDDASKSWIDASDLLVDAPGDDPARVIDARGFVRTDANGHFIFSNTSERVRFWGINFGCAANFPPCPDYPPQPWEPCDIYAAEKLAARLAKLGFNAVRMHLIDDPSGMIWLDPSEDTKQLSPFGLGRLDYFVYQLKRHGIYVDLNLHAGREFTRNDGVTDADAFAGTELTKNRGATMFDPIMIALQKRYAAQLLQHVNPYTGLAYADDPVILTTETSNEDSFFGPWCVHLLNHDPANAMSFPEFYSRELDGWTHLSGSGPTINRLLNPGFEAGLTEWYTFTEGSAQADFGLDSGAAEGSQALRIRVTQTDDVDWHVQFGQSDLAVLQGKTYRISFAVRASRAASVWGAVRRSEEPWDDVGWAADVPVTTQWVTHTIVFTAERTLFGDAQVVFHVGQAPLTLWFDSFRFCEVDAFRGWLGWLEDRYRSTTALAAAWAPTSLVPETEMLRNRSFEQGLTGWETYVGGTAAANWSLDRSQATDGAQSLKVTVTGVDGTDWHLQFWQPGLNIRAGRRYRVSFDAKSTVPGEVGLNVSQAHDPWDSLGLGTNTTVSTTWKHIEVVFEATMDETNARVGFDVGQAVRTLWFDNVSLKPYNPLGLLPGESLEENHVARLRRSEMLLFTPQRMRDTLQFYYETEAAFYADMQATIQNEIGSHSLNTGTAACSLPDSRAMAALNFVDNHHYWDFSSCSAFGQPADCLIHNRAWVNEPSAVLFYVAVSAVRGKPFTMTEFGEQFPNEHAVEGSLIIASFANLQDWDAIFTYGYSDDIETYTSEYVTGHSLAGNPLATGLMPVAARVFLGQQTTPAPTESLLSFTDAETYDSVHHGWAGFAADFLREEKGVDPAGAFGSRLRIGSFTAPAPVTPHLPTPPGPVYRSAGGQLTWDVSDPNRGLYTFNAPQTQGAVGFLAGRAVHLTNLDLTFPSDTAPFAAVTLQSQDEQPIVASKKMLLGVFTRVANTGMVWNADRTSLEEWGTAPTLIEPIRFTVTLTVNDTRNMQVWALDERGALHHCVSHEVPSAGRIRFLVDTYADKTLWYAVGRVWTAYLPIVLR